MNLETTPWRKIVGNEVLKITGWAWRSERSLWRTIVRVVHSQKMCSRIWQKKRSRHHEFRLDALGEIAELLALRKLVRSGVCPRALASPFFAAALDLATAAPCLERRGTVSLWRNRHARPLLRQTWRQSPSRRRDRARLRELRQAALRCDARACHVARARTKLDTTVSR